jgi:hypothetical protein
VLVCPGDGGGEGLNKIIIDDGKTDAAIENKTSLMNCDFRFQCLL